MQVPLAGSLGSARLLLSLPEWISTIATGASSWGTPIVKTALGSNPIGMAILMSLLILFNFNVAGISTKLQNAATLENTKKAVDEESEEDTEMSGDGAAASSASKTEKESKKITKKARKGGRRVTRKHKKHSAHHKRKSATRKHKRSRK